ncbi:MAG: hypothetical protein EHM45_19965 [Desulfobacteraceae bacterium]|nr:MAG: hypothetical protein EHM45_19965 [Desulfobacteraceae bacterium]
MIDLSFIRNFLAIGLSKAPNGLIKLDLTQNYEMKKRSEFEKLCSRAIGWERVAGKLMNPESFRLKNY